MRKDLRARSSLRTFATSSSSYPGCQFRSSVVGGSGVVDSLLRLNFVELVDPEHLREGLLRGGAAIDGGKGRRIVWTGAEAVRALRWAELARLWRTRWNCLLRRRTIAAERGM